MGNTSANINKPKKKVLTVMVNNSSNINKPKKKVSKVMVNNSTNINKPKESFNSDGQQFHQYQQNKRKF